MRRIVAMSRKKERSSDGVVSTERDGDSHLWEVNGTEVSIVRVLVSSVESWRRRFGETKAEIGRRRLERDVEEATCAKAISIVLDDRSGPKKREREREREYEEVK